MPHVPTHRDNPCSLAADEKSAAKIWELLRRNRAFLKSVHRISQLDRLRCDGEPDPNSRQITSRMVERVVNLNPFAGIAMKWLVPEPLFIIRHVIVAANEQPSTGGFVPLRVIKIEEGTTPFPDQIHWRTFEADGNFDAESIANQRGRLWRRGPVIRFQDSIDLRLRHEVNPIREWREYLSAGLKFTADTVWRNAPAEFKRDFSFLWRQSDSRPVNPITGTRIDAPAPHETTLFDEWSLLNFITSGEVDEEAIARGIMFNELSEKYRVFAFPKTIRTRTEARRAAEWLFNKLAEGLPMREPEQFGSALQWDVFLTVQDLLATGASHSEALQESFEIIHLRTDLWQEGAPLPDQRKGWAQRGADWENTYRIMDSPVSGTGLIQRVFPKFFG